MVPGMGMGDSISAQSGKAAACPFTRGRRKTWIYLERKRLRI